MAKLTVVLPDDTLSKFLRLEKGMDDIVEKSVSSAGAVLVKELREQARRAVSRLPEDQKRQTGQMINSIGLSPVGHTRDGNAINVKAGFAEPRMDGKANAMVANILESGKPGKSSSAKSRNNKHKKVAAKNSPEAIASSLEHGSSRQKAVPFIKKAYNSAKSPATEAFMKTFNEAVEKA